MFQWWKNKRQERMNRLIPKLKADILDLEEALDRQLTLFELKTKQYNDFMVEAEIRTRRFNDLLQEEKENNGRLLVIRTEQIGTLKKEMLELELQIEKLSHNNDVLRQSLGHF